MLNSWSVETEEIFPLGDFKASVKDEGQRVLQYVLSPLLASLHSNLGTVCFIGKSYAFVDPEPSIQLRLTLSNNCLVPCEQELDFPLSFILKASVIQSFAQNTECLQASL